MPHDTTPRFYVYILSRPDGRPFYVGKGSGRRAFDHESEARSGHRCQKCHTIRKIWKQGGQVQRTVVYTTDDEQDAYRYECELIAAYGRDNLCNQTDGGEGQSGRTGELAGPHKLTQAQVDAIRAAYSSTTVTVRSLAERYGVSQPAIEKIVYGRSWAGTKLIRDPAIRLQNGPRGESHPNAKLTWDDVRAIRAVSGTESNAAIAARYGVTPHVIRSILHNQTWHDPSYDPSTYVPVKPRAVGERNQGARLTWDDVRAIRARYQPRVVTVPMLAAEYGVSVGCIEKIVLGVTWRE